MSTSISKVEDTNPNESLTVSLIIESAEGMQKRLTKLSKKAKLSEIKTTLKLEPNYKFLNVDDEEMDDKLFQFNEFLNTQEFPVLNISDNKKTIKLSALERPRSTKEPTKVEFSELSSPYRNLNFIEASQPDMAPQVTITSIPEKSSCYKTQAEELAQKSPLKNGKYNLGYNLMFNYANMHTFSEKSSLLNENHVSYQVTQPSKVSEATIISKAEKSYWDLTQLSDELIQSLLKNSKYNFGYTPMFGYANKPIFLEDWSRFNKTHISNNYPATKSLLWEKFSEILKAKMFVDEEARAKVKQVFWIAANQICNKEKVGKASQSIHFYAEKLIPKGSYNVRELCHKTVPEFQNFFPKDQNNKWIITKERFREFIQEYGLFFPTELVFGGKVYIQEAVWKHEDFEEKKRSIEAYAKAALELVSAYSQNDASTSHSRKLTLHSLGGKPIVQGNPEDWLASLINNPQSCAVIKLRGLKYTFEFLEEELNQAIQSFLKNEEEVLVEESMANNINPGKALKNPFEYGPNYNMMLSFLSLIKKQIKTPVESSKIELIESILRKELENQRQYIYSLKMRELISATTKIRETNKKPLVKKSSTRDSDSLLNKKLAIPLKNVSNHKMRSMNYETMTAKDSKQKASVGKSHTRDIDSYSEKALENPFEYVVNYKVKALAHGAKRISYLLLFRSDYLEIAEVEQKDRWISMIEDYAQTTKDSVVYFDCDGCKCSSEHEAVERSIPKFVM